jgi:hypothetical protein
MFILFQAPNVFIVFFCPLDNDAPEKLFFHCERAVHNLKHQAQESFNQ